MKQGKLATTMNNDEKLSFQNDFVFYNSIIILNFYEVFGEK
jgi:hypothetical protein